MYDSKLDILINCDIQWNNKSVTVSHYKITPFMKDKLVDKVVQIKHDGSRASKKVALLEALDQMEE